MIRRFDRRTFLKYSIATSIVWSGWDVPRSLGISVAEAAELFKANADGRTDDVFPQSVASGDPQARGITLWTRIVPSAARGRGEVERDDPDERDDDDAAEDARRATADGQDRGRRRRRRKVAFEVATNAAMTQVVLRGVVDAEDDRDFAVKTQLDNAQQLRPFTTYYYRFVFRGTRSKVGRFKTLPAPNQRVQKLRFGYISCQDYAVGYYTALAHLANEASTPATDLDFVAHLGDYIYETVDDPTFQNNQVRPIRLPSGRERAETLEDYRFLYQTYRSDADLQRVHELYAFITIWDDHEFANDSYREYDTDSENEAANRDPQRRQAANQAWAEYTPIGVPFRPNQGPLESLQIYRSFAFGDLLELVMTDERLYRDGPPCGLTEVQRYVTPGCPEVRAPGRTMLGREQKAWFLNKLTGSTRTWKMWGNEVMVMPLRVLGVFANGLLSPPQPLPNNLELFVTLDAWDGYVAERTEILKRVRDANVKNVVLLTGDIHTFIAGELTVNFTPPTIASVPPPPAPPVIQPAPAEPTVGVCFVVSSVTSANLAEIGTFGNGTPLPDIGTTTYVIQQSNPHIKYFNSQEHGYNVMDVTPTEIICTMKAVVGGTQGIKVRNPLPPIRVAKRFRVKNGESKLIEA